MFDPVSLLERLVAIRSDRQASPDGNMEKDVVAFLRSFVADALPWLVVETHEIGNGRTNLFVHDGAPTRFFFLGHMDTVEEGTGWTRNPRGERDGDRLYGRGSADMKAGIVSILEALAHAHETNKTGVAALFYCDEEYAFAGMKRFVKDYAGRLEPELVVCPEPTQEALRPGCRGVTEFRATLIGKRGHAARPHSGVSAFRAFQEGLRSVENWIADRTHPVLGAATINIAAVQCGSRPTDGTNGLSSSGNVIPDFCESVVEVRTVPGVTTADLVRVFSEGARTLNAEIQSLVVEHDIGSFLTPTEQLKNAQDAQRRTLGDVRWEDIALAGYSDAQMIAQEWNVPVVVWGPAGGGMHGPDEWVDLPSMRRLSDAYRALVDML